MVARSPSAALVAFAFAAVSGALRPRRRTTNGRTGSPFLIGSKRHPAGRPTRTTCGPTRFTTRATSTPSTVTPAVRTAGKSIRPSAWETGAPRPIHPSFPVRTETTGFSTATVAGNATAQLAAPRFAPWPLSPTSIVSSCRWISDPRHSRAREAIWRRGELHPGGQTISALALLRARGDDQGRSQI